jgi:hypothetical protein
MAAAIGLTSAAIGAASGEVAKGERFGNIVRADDILADVAAPSSVGQPATLRSLRSGAGPLIGVGLPAALVVGGILLGARLIQRRR